MIKKKITIINSNIHNIYNLIRTFESMGYRVKTSEGKEKKINSDIVILPGVGSFGEGMNYLKKNGLDDKIKEFVENKNKFLLGICLGMQLLFSKSSEFKETKGLNLISGYVSKLKNSYEYKIPHIGWALCTFKNKKDDIFYKRKYFYFNHSYFVNSTNKDTVVATTEYGSNNFISIVKDKNILGLQFHPEKSEKQGKKILRDFLKL